MVRGIVAVVAFALIMLSGCAAPGHGPAAVPSPAGSQVVSPAIDQHSRSAVPPVVGGCTVTRTAANTALGYGVNPDAVTGAKTFCDFADVAPGNLTRFAYAVIELAWQAQSSETSIGLRINANCQPGDQPETPGQACVVAKSVANAPPLRIVLRPDQMQRYADAGMTAYVFSEGVSVQHPFDVKISLFEQGPVPDGYTGFTLL